MLLTYITNTIKPNIDVLQYYYSRIAVFFSIRYISILNHNTMVMIAFANMLMANKFNLYLCVRNLETYTYIVNMSTYD